MANDETPEFNAGELVFVIGYEQVPPDGKLFEDGDIAEVVSYSAANGAVVKALNDERRQDTFYETEIRAATQEEVDAFRAKLGGQPASEETAETVVEATPVAETPAPAPETTYTKKGSAKGKGTKKDRANEAVAAAAAQTPAPAASSAASSADTAVSPANESQPRPVVLGNDSAAVQAIIENDDALQAAERLNNQVEETYMTLGGVLAHIYGQGLHKKLGYEGKRAFATYVEERLGMQYRKAMYLIDIYAAFTKLGIPEERLAELGWSKVKELVRVTDPDRVNDLIEFAKAHTRRELIEHMRDGTVNAGEGDGTTQVRKTVFNFAVVAEAANNVTAALDAAKNMCGSSDLNDCFEYIVSEWRSMQDGIELPFEEAKAMLEARYKVQVAVVDPAEAQNQEVAANAA